MKKASDKIQKTTILPDTFKSGGIKVYSCMSGEAVNGRVNLKEYFSKQVISPVNFVSTIESASKECDLMLEVGPGRVLTDLVKSIDEKIVCLPLESATGNDRDLNIALAEIFVRNVPVKWEELYKNRLIKTFVPASKKKFIENQCEHPLKIDKQILTNKFAPVLLQVQEEADREEVEKAKEPEIIIPGGLPEVKGKGYIADLLINLTHKITGFDLESISLNLRLLDDLNLDSIKAAELIGQAARTLGIAGQVDPSQLSNKTLEEIGDRLYVLSEQTKAGTAKESVSDILKRYQDKTWVRNFTPELKHEEIKTKNVNQLKDLKNVLLLSGKDDESLVKKIENAFKTIKAKTQKISFGDGPGKTEKSGHVNCLIAVLPHHSALTRHPAINSRHPERSEGSLQFNKDSLKSTIEQLHQITGLAQSKHLDKGSFVVFVQFGGGATSIASTLFLEQPDLKVRVIDFDKATDEEKIAQKIMDELQTYEDFSAVNYDSQLARRVVYYENSNPAAYKKRDISWSNKDVVLVTGGAKGITAQLALEFARTTQAHMALIGRSPMPEGKKDGTNEIIQTLEQFKNEHLKCSYYQCDVTNEKDVLYTVGEIEKKLGRITGFIHGAGLNSLKRLKQATVQEAYQESLPKVMGAVNVCNALKNYSPKLIVGITSIIGLTGMEGSGWYGFSNELLNLYLQHKSNVLTIAYSIWDEVGMGAKLGSVNRLAEKGIGAIPVKEGIKHFKQLIEGDPGTQQVIVAARVAGIATWKSAEVKPNNFRFLENIEYILPGVELIARANLNTEDDPYLLDHNWKGSLLFPFVFGFEAMAQAVAYVLGIEKFDHIKARDINLQRPIPVSQDSGTTIEIHARVLGQEKSNEDKQVRVEIYSQDTAYKEPHFSATFIVITRSEATKQSFSTVIARSKATKQSPSTIIDLDIQTDIYGPILFQGKMFQCIEQIHELYYDEESKKGECVFISLYNKSADDFFRKNKNFNKRFLIGDPFFIDSILQSMQVMIPQDLCLPKDIGDIEVNLLQHIGNTKYLVRSNIKRINVDYYRCDAVVDTNGFSLKIKNCQLKVLDTILSNPSANDLVDPTQRDQVIIEKKINELAQQMGFIVPAVRYLYDSRLKTSSRQERHKIEHLLIQSTVYEFLHEGNKRPKSIKVGWLKSGRPVLLNKELDHIKISLSHCDNSLICVLGNGEQGCDIENIVKRSEGDWLALLGVRKFSLQKSLIDLGFDLDFSGTVVWSAFETFKKIFDKIDPDFELSETYKNQVIFSNDQASVCCMSIEMTRGNLKIFSFAINAVKESIRNKFNTDIKFSRKIGFNENQLFGVKIDCSGPQKQLVLTQRFPVTFKTNQMLSRRVYFTNFFDWIGTIRENSVYPTFKDLVKLTESGEWGLVTNMTELRILGGIKCNDIVEAKIWGGDLEGDKNATTPMFFEWYRITDGGRRERVAVAKQKSTWVSIRKDHSVAIEKMPKFLGHYLDLMRPMTNEISDREICPEPYESINLGNKVKSYNMGILHEFKIEERIFSTTLENSNIVGNIYFANYPRWLGAVGDAFFYKLVPSYFVNVADKNEIICLECNIYYLNDAFPFEDVLVEMYLDEIYENGLILYFEFYRIKESKKQKKLAYAKQKIVFAHWSNEIEPDAIKIPNEVKDFIKNKDLN